MRYALILILSVLFSQFSNPLLSQKRADTFKATAQFQNSRDKLVSIHNINGSIEVEGYNGTEVIIEVNQIYKAKSERLLDQAQQELSVQVVEKDNEVIIYFDTPSSHFDIDKKSYRSYNGHSNKRRYSNLFDFTVKVPRDASVEASTMNSGDIAINNISASEISASNLNGPISMDNISGTVYANALNKDIDISYVSNPTEDSYYNSLNGDVRIKVQPNLNAQVFFTTLNGKIYADLDNSEIKTKLVKNASSERGTKFKIDKNRQFTIGSGGPELHFDLLNGDVTISE